MPTDWLRSCSCASPLELILWDEARSPTTRSEGLLEVVFQREEKVWLDWKVDSRRSWQKAQMSVTGCGRICSLSSFNVPRSASMSVQSGSGGNGGGGGGDDLFCARHCPNAIYFMN